MKHELIARRMQEALSEANISARELSQRSGVSEASISQYINGRNVPSNLSAGKMAEILKCDPVWLMGFNIPVESKIPVTAEETLVISAYRNLTEDQKYLVCRMLGIRR